MVYVVCYISDYIVHLYMLFYELLYYMASKNSTYHIIIIIYNRLFNTKFTLVQQRQVIKQKGPYTSRSSKADTSLI